jgi:hypothetical protein
MTILQWYSSFAVELESSGLVRGLLDQTRAIRVFGAGYIAPAGLHLGHSWYSGRQPHEVIHGHQ